MRKSNTPSMPRINQFLDSTVFKESKVIFGKNYLENKVSSIVNLEQAGRAHCELLLLDEKTALNGLEKANLSKLAGVVILAKMPKLKGRRKTAANRYKYKSEFNTVEEICRKSKAPLVVLASDSNLSKALKDVRSLHGQFLEHKGSESEIYSQLFNTVLEYGLDGLVKFLSEELRRPVCIETIDFKILSSQKMAATPVTRRKTLLSDCQALIDSDSFQSTDKYIRLGKRLVVPLIQGDNSLVGFLSVMVRSYDDEKDLLWLLKPASLASMVVLVQRKRGEKGTASAKKSLLRDLLEGRVLSSVEMEKVEIHFGFDFYDGFYLLGVDVLHKKTGQKSSSVNWPDEIYVSVEVEDTKVFVVPFLAGSKLTYEEASQKLASAIRARNKDVLVQVGVSRAIHSMLEFHESYKQARQSLIIGSMMNPGTEYTIGYGDLGLKRLLYLIIDHPELEQFYKETLGPLEEYDREWDTELTETLKVYVNHGANLNLAARKLFIHRHTLRYRLEQIEDDILNIDVDSQEVLLNLQVAFLIKQLLNMS